MPLTYIGRVLSNRMQKSILVGVDRVRKHPLLGVYIRSTRKYMTHDEKQLCRMGDLVEIRPCPKMSKRKAFMLHRIIRHQEQIGDYKPQPDLMTGLHLETQPEIIPGSSYMIQTLNPYATTVQHAPKDFSHAAQDILLQKECKERQPEAEQAVKRLEEEAIRVQNKSLPPNKQQPYLIASYQEVHNKKDKYWKAKSTLYSFAEDANVKKGDMGDKKEEKPTS